MNRKTKVLAAVLRAEKLLPAWQKAFPHYPRPFDAILAAREWSKRPCHETQVKAYGAAKDAAWAGASLGPRQSKAARAAYAACDAAYAVCR